MSKSSYTYVVIKSYDKNAGFLCLPVLVVKPVLYVSIGDQLDIMEVELPHWDL
jgi:hypothetical protein